MEKEVRNFVIISHIDHGKSTLADRLLEITGTIQGSKMRPQFLDMMELEREKGITIKLKPVRMETKIAGVDYIFNLVDTPGHVDFSYEVSRALAAVEGAVLLVDATQGIQAQTLANLHLAQQQNLIIIPVVNKIDLSQAETEKTVKELADLLKVPEEEVLRISAKMGTNIAELLQTIAQRIPSPQKEQEDKPFRALIFDSDYDAYKGVIAFVRIVDGSILQGEKIKLLATGAVSEIKEIGVFRPDLSSQKELKAGDIGYVATGIKEPGKVRVGDTLSKQVISNDKVYVQPLAGYQDPKPMVFASLYPEDAANYDFLKDALSKLRLSDPALTSEPEMKEVLGRGFRCGFLGTLHTEIVAERLKREFGLDLVISTPSVSFKVMDHKNRESYVYSPGDWPPQSDIKEALEPWVALELLTPTLYMGKVIEVMNSFQSVYLSTDYFGSDRVFLKYETPLRSIIANLYDKIKSVTQGYASMNYTLIEYRPADLVKMDILIAGENKEAFSRIVPREEAFREGKRVVAKLKEVLPPEQFTIALQAAVDNKIIARETIGARRKDVTGYLYGGDYSRKKKLLEKQKKGKKELKSRGRVQVPTKVFLEVFRS